MSSLPLSLDSDCDDTNDAADDGNKGDFAAVSQTSPDGFGDVSGDSSTSDGSSIVASLTSLVGVFDNARSFTRVSQTSLAGFGDVSGDSSTTTNGPSIVV